jgi:hypothetical protein
LRTDKNIITLNGPWKFTVGDNMQYALSNYDDSGWETMDLTAPPGAHDDDVGLSGYIPGWTAKGHSNYSGYAWYRLNVPLDSVPANNLALAASPAVDDAYQLFINGSIFGSAGDFSGTVPIVYSIQPRMFLLPSTIKKEKNITIAIRVWMSSASLGPDAGGIHIRPGSWRKNLYRKKIQVSMGTNHKRLYRGSCFANHVCLAGNNNIFTEQEQQTTQSCKWFITALILLGLVRLNQAVYFWFQIESGHQATIVGSAILRPLALGSWLMAWWEWFDLHKPKWLPKIIAILTLLYMANQLLGLSWVSNSIIHFRQLQII